MGFDPLVLEFLYWEWGSKHQVGTGAYRLLVGTGILF